jgi:hypothetical protein
METPMNAKRPLAAALMLATIAPGCSVGDHRLAMNAVPENSQPAPTVPGPAVMLHGVRWEPSLAAAMAAGRQCDPARPIVLLRLLGTLDDKL